MLTVIAENKFKEESIDSLKDLCRELIEQTKKEDGCIDYYMVQSTTNPGHLTMIEKWENLESLQKHGANPLFLEMVKKLSPFSEQKMEVKIYQEFL